MARILLVDDEAFARTLYGDVLRQAGHEVITASGVAEGRARLSERFDAIVTDLLLGDGDGMEVLEEAQQAPGRPSVVVITALDRVGPAVRAVKAGASDYLIKPVPAEALQHAVQRSLAVRQLLAENEALRRHTALMQTGQRIATCLDHEQIGRIAPHAFQNETGASAAVLFRHDAEGGGFSLLAMNGLAEEEQEDLAFIPAHGQSSPEVPTPRRFDAALTLPVAEDGQPPERWVSLFFESPPQDDSLMTAEETGRFLARNLALAFRNAERFAEAEDLAYLDDLTRLYNRRFLERALERSIETARSTEGGSLGVLFLDVDNLKQVNDVHGHLVGSSLLVEVGRVIRACLRDRDAVARYGGDEFVALLEGTDQDGALRVAERIRNMVASHSFLAREKLGLQVTVSIGAAAFPDDGREPLQLLESADKAMYVGKRAGRNRAVRAESNRSVPTSTPPAGQGPGPPS